MQSLKLVAVVMVACLLNACQQSGPASTSAVNAGNANIQNTNAVAGTVVNGNTATNAAPVPLTPALTPMGGALLGNALTNGIGKSLDNSDRAAYDAVSQHALETGQPGQTMAWKNPQSGNSGTVTPQNYSQNSTGQYCRDYSESVVAGTQKQDGYGKACRQPDGTWQLVQ